MVSSTSMFRAREGHWACSLGACRVLDAMVPVGAPLRKTAAGRATKTRLVVHRDGARLGGQHARSASRKNLWAPAARGRAPSTCRRRASPRSSRTATSSRSSSNIDVRAAEALQAREVGGDHFRSSAMFLTQAHPQPDARARTSTSATSIDQIYAQRFGQDTPIPSMQLCIENVDQAGGCAYGYSCVYTDSISWAVADRAAADGARPARGVRSALRRRRDAGRAHASGSPPTAASSTGSRTQSTRLRRRSSARATGAASTTTSTTCARSSAGFQRVEARNASGETRELPDAPLGVPDSFNEHVKLMFDLQALAFAVDLTRVFAFKLGRDGSNRVYPESGVTTGFHSRVAPRREGSTASSTSRRSTAITSASCRTSSRS